MKKILPLLLFVLVSSTLTAKAEYTTTACYEMGFDVASKAYLRGNKSAFTPVYGMSAQMMKKSPCCNTGVEIQCMAYNAAFQYVQQNGADKNTLEYMEKLDLFRKMDTGMVGF